MYRIDDATAAPSLPTPESAAAEGYFTEGNPATGTPATKVRASWLNMIQEELRGLVTAAGLTPSKTNYSQVAAAVRALISGAAQGINSSAKINGVNSANLLVNGSGELGASGWSLAANFLAVIDSTGGFGGYFGNTSALSNASGSNFTGNISVGAGVQLTLSFDAMSSVSAGSYSVALVAYNSSGAFIGNVAAVTVPNGASTSTRYYASGTTPAGTAYITSSFNITGVTAPAYGVIWRRVKVEQGNTPSLYSQESSITTIGAGMPVVGSVRNLRMYVPAAASTATVTADEVVVCSTLGGVAYKVGSVNHSINLAGANGIGGMDTGSAPVNGYVAIYEMVNPSTGAKGLMGVNATSSVAPSIYGGSSAPLGYSASALLTVVPTNGSGQFAAVLVRDRNVSFPIKTALSSSTVQGTFTSLSIAGIVPPNAVSIIGEMSLASTSSSTAALTVVADSNGIGQQNSTATVTATGYVGNFQCQIATPQTIYWGSSNSAGTPTFLIFISAYSI
ncbi:hypothetical protein [Burkholderia stabilis]|uniref:hypothetical protein n=1 Tax=Burkholderia stabilis TaxID=95485 RepID=UPI001F4BBCEE|nr:hypothetical protein [Burkholderia stabilis]